MSSFKKRLVLAAALVAPTSMVQAADLIVEPAPMPIPQEITPVGVVGGWYIRGDIGYASFDTDVYYAPQPGYGFQEFSQSDLDSTWVLEGGIGYQVNDFFRVDATLAYYHDIELDGRSSSGDNFDCSLITADNSAYHGYNDDDGKCSVSDTAQLSAYTFMANAYLDLGTYNGFTPYVGAGLGVAKVKWGDLDNDIACTTSATNDCLADNGHNYDTDADGSHKGITEARVAWALHAGASYDISCRVKADVGYSYTHIEGGDMFGYGEGGSAYNAGGTDSGTQGYSSDISIHSGTVGLRYALSDAGCVAPYYEQPEVVYK